MSETVGAGNFRSNVVGELARYVFQGYEPSQNCDLKASGQIIQAS